MKFTILMGSPRPQGNTAALLAPFLEECRFLGIQTQCIHLYDKKVGPCLGCMACQDVPDSLGCVQKDDFAQIFQEMEDCDVIVLATPVYAFFCTAPMKALLDRAIYAGNKSPAERQTGGLHRYLRIPAGSGGRPLGGGPAPLVQAREGGVSGDVLPPGPGEICAFHG